MLLARQLVVVHWMHDWWLHSEYLHASLAHKASHGWICFVNVPADAFTAPVLLAGVCLCSNSMLSWLFLEMRALVAGPVSPRYAFGHVKCHEKHWLKAKRLKAKR